MWKTVAWKDQRLIIDPNNSFWKSENSESIPGAIITERFVEECLWTPQMTFLNALPTAGKNLGSNSEQSSFTTFYVSKDQTLTSLKRHGRLTFSCPMWFSNFPFDVQVHKTTSNKTYLNFILVV